MRALSCITLLLGLAVARADEPQAILAKALTAHGGVANLAKFQAYHAKIKGALVDKATPTPFTGEVWFHGKDRFKMLIEVKVCEARSRLVTALDGDKGWNQLDGETEDMGAEDLADARREAYETWVMRLVPLKDKAFKLTPAPEVKIGDRPAVGFTVAHEGRGDVTLHFDKESGLHVKTTSRARDEEADKEVAEETVYSDFRDVQGVKSAMRFVVQRDGKPYLEGTTTNLQLLEKLDAATFARPK
jgi:hypothetical protein